MHLFIKNNQKRLSIIIMIFILLGWRSVLADKEKRDSFTGIDKLEHFAVSAAMTASTAFVLHNHFQTNRDNAIIIGFATSFSFGGIKEIIDKRTPGEQSSWKDLAADILGCTAGALIIKGAMK